MAFNTGNPLGSTDPRDLSDNAENFDKASNSSEPTFADRLGATRKTLSGMESEFNADQSSRETTFQAFISSSGYEFLGDYAAAIEVTAYNQVIRESGEFWKPAASTSLPYTTTGAGMPEGGAFVSVGDASLRQEVGGGIRRISNLAALEGISGRFSGDVAYMVGRTTAGDGGEGKFRWDSSDLSAEVSADPQNGIYIPPLSDATGASGAWVRQLEGAISIKWFGALGDGVNDDAPAIQGCLDYAIANNFAAYAPAGVYLITGDSLTNNRIEPSIPNDSSIVFYGDGPDKTTIKERDGDTALYGSFHKMLYFNIGAGVTVKYIEIKGMTLDKNGASNGAPPTAFEWQQSHAIDIYVDSAGLLNFANLEGVVTRDKVGGGIVFSAGPVQKASVRDCIGEDFSDLFGERGDLEFQASIADFFVENSGGSFVQSEPNVSTPFSGIEPSATFYSCRYETMDFVGYSGDIFAQHFTINNCDNGASGDFWVRDGVLKGSGNKLRVRDVVDWRNCDVEISDSTITVAHDTGSDSFETLLITSISLERVSVLFDNCGFVSDDTASATTTGYAVRNSEPVPTANIDDFVVKFRDCEFDPVFQYTADFYRAGTVIFERTKLASRSGGWAVQGGGLSGNISDITFDSCDLSQMDGALLRVANSADTGWRLRLKGKMDYSKFSLLNRPTTEYETTSIVDDCVWMSGSRPSAGGYLGQLVQIRQPEYGGISRLVCSAGSLTSATWKLSGQAGAKSGTTANRPTLVSDDSGLLYFDTTLDADGKPIWWNGTAWVDATGAVV